MEKKLFLLDAYALIYRAYYALIRAPRFTSKGFNTSAIFGFCNTLDDVLRKEKPTHMAVCFDPKGGHTFRHELYPEYKAQRDAQPEDITLAIPYIKRIIKAYSIPTIEVPGYEADDVIGTIARKAEAEGFTTYMMTFDKDYGQLVTEHTMMYRPPLRGQDFEIRGPKEVCERYGIADTRQVIDLLALEGDSSDNIPGCPGVGEKTAIKLIEEWGSVDNLLANTDKLKGALQKKVSENIDQILLAKTLVTIHTNAPVDIDFNTLRIEERDINALREVFTELEFKSFLAKLPDVGLPLPTPTSEKPASNVPSMGSLFDLPEQPEEPNIVIPVAMTDPRRSEQVSINEYVDKAIQAGTVGIATYATGDEAMTASFQGIALAISANDAAWYPYPTTGKDITNWTDALQKLFTSDTTIVSHDVKRDIILLRNLEISFTAPYNDTSVAHYLLQPEMRHRLADLAMSYLGIVLTGSEGETSTRKSPYSPLPFNEAPRRMCENASIVISLMPLLSAELNKGDLMKLYEQIELPFIRVLAEMEWTGVRINIEELSRLSAELTARVNELENQCFDLAGTHFNIASPKQVGEVLFDRLKIDPSAKRTKNGAYSTTEEILEKYRNSHPIVDCILKIRGLNKLLATYINALPSLINPATGKIHTTYNQTVTATGRISSANPNLQNIPVRTDDGREIRRAFIPDVGCLFMSADYSQIELRLMADMSGDPEMLAAFASGADIHRATAAKIYHTSLDDVSDTQRRNAKTANFGIIYGISAFGLAERLGIPRAEAKTLIDGYFTSYPTVRDYINSTIEKARQNGYVTTIMGRKRFLPDINSRNAVVRSYAERNAVNAPLQGSAADIIKIAMIAIYHEMKQRNLRSRMIMQVHDELVFNVIPEEMTELQELVTRQMENAYTGRVCLEVASGVGCNWLEAH